jgi:endonuclease-3
MGLLPAEDWGRLSDVLIWHGRRVCAARTPRCDQCMLADICPSAGTG